MYSNYNTIYSQNLEQLKPQKSSNSEFLKANNIQSNWQYRQYLTNNTKITKPYDSFETPHKLYEKIDEDNRHNKSDLKVFYHERLQNQMYKIAPVITEYK